MHNCPVNQSKSILTMIVPSAIKGKKSGRWIWLSIYRWFSNNDNAMILKMFITFFACANQSREYITSGWYIIEFLIDKQHRYNDHTVQCSLFIGFIIKGGTISLTIPTLKNTEEGLVSPHWLVTSRITPSFPSNKTNLANLCKYGLACGSWELPVRTASWITCIQIVWFFGIRKTLVTSFMKRKKNTSLYIIPSIASMANSSRVNGE